MATDTICAWGGDDRYYADTPAVLAATKPKPTRGPSLFPKQWSELVEERYPGLEDRVFRTYKQWNSVLREIIRVETGLRLSIGDDSRAVPVRLASTMPPPLLSVLEKWAPVAWAIINKRRIIGVRDGASFMREHLDEAFRTWEQQTTLTNPQELARVEQTAAAWLDALAKSEAELAITSLDQDVLGAYFFRVPAITLYWVPIGIAAAILDSTPEAVTVVTLAHELSHAYTHLGRDIDEREWDTEAFAKTDLHIVEGLAQFYTEAACDRLAARFPQARQTFDALLDKQNEVYKEHRQWLGATSHTGEIVRVSMIECRTRNIQSPNDFRGIVKKHHKSVTGSDAPAVLPEGTPPAPRNARTRQQPFSVRKGSEYHKP